jgi:DNA-binding NarL/FixJ family response regulator
MSINELINVARHLQSIYQKLNVTSRLKAISVTQKFGIFGKR